MKLLALDTATENCSAAVLAGGLLHQREEELGRGHAERILAMVDELLRDTGLTLGALDAIAFGRGPGAFTGLRLAASVAQGLAFGAGVPVVPVSNLQALAQRVLDEQPGAGRVLACSDARMQEVYWGCFARGPDGFAQAAGPERVSPPGDVRLPDGWAAATVHGAGRGFAAYAVLGEALQLAATHHALLPRAAEIVRLAVPEVLAGRVLAPELAHPVYLRDDVARPQVVAPPS
jgi:tRNA threonylcarbamoyladenosine biosynthesis protein TsaB